MIEHEAAIKLRTYVAARGRHPVRVTKHLVRYWWGIINRAVFDGTLLPARHIELMYSDEVYAWAIPGSNGRIDLHIQNHFHERTTFLTVLIHEMVHAWEFMMYGRMGHGSRFTKWTTTIEQRTPLILRKTIRDYEHSRKRPNRRYSKRSVGGDELKATGPTADIDIQTLASGT